MADVAMRHMPSNFSKLDKFEGVDFKRWQKKMHFLLSSMSVVYVLTTPIPKDGLIRNGMSDSLFDIYQNIESFKELWDSLAAKHMVEDASSKKFLVSCIIYKLHPSWKDFKHTLKHQKEELTLVELGSHLRIKESLRVQDNDKPKGNNVVGSSVVNMVEHNNSFRYNDNKGKRKHQDNKFHPNKKSKVTCWKCEKPGHLKKDCKGGKVSNKANGSGTNGLVNDSSNTLKGVTMHMYKDRCWFKTYESLNDGSILHMGNESTTLSVGIIHETTIPYTPQQNGISERKNMVLKEMVNSMLSCSGLSQGFWGEAMLTSCYLLNRVPRKRNKITPYELWTKRKPNMNYPRVWGCRAVDDPKTFDEAMKSQDVVFYKEEINDEMDSILGNKTWVLAYLPPGCKPLGWKWIFKRKPKVVTHISTIRLLIVMASIHNMIIHHMNVKTSFLNGELDKEVYMNQPQGFIMLGNENKVCKLIKSLYGLNQAPK
ncbi:zinc finger, CCHC-type containing protein [Tanacetum coccineum]